jgi:hypothetical protein
MEETKEMLEEIKEKFDGAVIGSKQFPFKPLTVTQSRKILRRLMLPSFYQRTKNVFLNAFAKTGRQKRWWKRVRGTAFVKTGWWHIGIVPKELRCSVIPQKKAEEIEDDFFAYAEVTVKEYNELLILSRPSLMVKSKRNVNS